MVKLLVCGGLNGEWTILLNRVLALQNSAHGPFDALFITGSLSPGDMEPAVLSALSFPIPTYIFSPRLPIVPPLELPDNLKYINESNITDDVGLVTLHGLTVGYAMASGDLTSAGAADAIASSSKASYRGCDIFLTAEWPRDIYQFLDESSLESLKACGGFGGGSKDVSDLCSALRPRYHFAASKNLFYQRPPFRNFPSAAGKESPVTRFIGLANVTMSKDKDKKYLHALSLEPIVYLSNEAVSEVPVGSTDNPFAAVGRVKHGLDRSAGTDLSKRAKAGVGAGGGAGGVSGVGSSSVLPAPGRFAALEAEKPAASGAFFFGHMGASRPGTGSGAGGAGLPMAGNLNPPSESCKTLFLGGVGREVKDRELLASMPHSIRVTRPEGKAFVFVDFEQHEHAAAVVKASIKQPLVLGGKAISVGWAKGRSEQSSSGSSGAATPQLCLTPPSADCKTLFVGGLPFVVSEVDLKSSLPNALQVRCLAGKPFAFVEYADHQAAQEAFAAASSHPILYQGKELKLGWAQTEGATAQLGSRYGSGSGDGDGVSKAIFVGGLSSSCPAREVEALLRSHSLSIEQVRKASGREYAFVDFSSHEEASRALALNGSLTLEGRELTLGWAMGKSADRHSDHDAECWFCLGSSTLKAHLIVSVGEHAYAALPRGGIVAMHVMVSPIECVPNRLHLSQEGKLELQKYESAIDSLFASTGSVSLRFERTIRTKGKDHMQEHLIPIPAHKVSQALTIFMQLAAQNSLHFSEIEGSMDVDEAVLGMPGGPFQEYFFIELPVGAVTATDSTAGGKQAQAKKRKFIHVPAVASASSSVRFPMQFGLEVAARVIGFPERSNWKNCLLSEKEEEKLAEKFKSMFAQFDFTL